MVHKCGGLWKSTLPHYPKHLTFAMLSPCIRCFFFCRTCCRKNKSTHERHHHNIISIKKKKNLFVVESIIHVSEFWSKFENIPIFKYSECGRNFVSGIVSLWNPRPLPARAVHNVFASGPVVSFSCTYVCDVRCCRRRRRHCCFSAGFCCRCHRQPRVWIRSPRWQRLPHHPQQHRLEQRWDFFVFEDHEYRKKSVIIQMRKEDTRKRKRGGGEEFFPAVFFSVGGDEPWSPAPSLEVRGEYDVW